MHHLAHRDDLLAAGAIACSSTIEAGRYEQGLFYANRVIQAMKPVLPNELAHFPLAHAATCTGERSSELGSHPYASWGCRQKCRAVKCITCPKH